MSQTRRLRGQNELTMYPLTLFSSTANVFIASCILSKLVDFHTKSAVYPCVISVGTPSDRLNSKPISSETSTAHIVSHSAYIDVIVTRTVRDFNDMPITFPGFVKGAIILQSKLVADSETDFATFELRQAEPRDALLIETKIPANGDVGLSL